MLPLKNRLKNKDDFNKAYRYGKSLFCDKIVLKVKKNNLPVIRIGISVGVKNFKKAVTRNRLKRQVRAFFLDELKKIKPGFDFIIIIQKGWDEKNNPNKVIAKILAKNSFYN